MNRKSFVFILNTTGLPAQDDVLERVDAPPLEQPAYDHDAFLSSMTQVPASTARNAWARVGGYPSRLPRRY